MKKSIGLLFFFSLVSLFIVKDSRADICCKRHIETRISATEGAGSEEKVTEKDIRFLKSAVSSGVTYKGPRDSDCPLRVSMGGRLDYGGSDYLLDCDYKVLQAAGIGDYHTFTVRLIDPHHGNNVLAGPKEISWYGEMRDRIRVNPTGGQTNRIKELVMNLRPFDDKIYDYERIPQTCTIRPEKEEMAGGETINIRISEIKDHKGRPSQPFQRIMVKVNIGKIKNGVNDHPYYVFQVPDSGGEVNAVYQAPEKCDFDTEIITVYNSCNWLTPLSCSLWEEEIARSEIKVDDLQPISCKVTPEKGELEPGAEVTIRLTDFKEQEERTLGPDEKILVKAEDGTITNGRKHGEYRIFTIKSGTVEVAYQVPELCDQDNDAFKVYSVCEDEETGEIKKNKEIATKQLKFRKVSCDLSVNIKAVFQWKETKGRSRSEGNATMQIRGSMKFDDSMDMPFVKRYTPGKMMVVWSMKEKTIDLSPNKGCPELIFEYSGGGSSSLPDPRLLASSFLQIHRFGDLFPMDMPIPIPEEAKSQMVDSFQIVLGGATQTLRGRHRAGGICGEDACPCKEYKPKEKKISVGTLFIRGKMDKNGNMSGNHYWIARGHSLSGIGFTVDEVGEKPEYKPKPLKVVDDNVMNVSVNWDIQAYQ